MKRILRIYKMRRIVKYLQKEIIWRCFSYEELEQMNIGDIFTHEGNCKLLKGEIAIIIRYND